MSETVTVGPVVERRGPEAMAENAGGLILEDYAHLLDDLIEGAGCDVIEDESSDAERGVDGEQVGAFLAYLEALGPELFVDDLAGDPPDAAFGIHESMPDYAERRAAAVAFVRAVKAAAPQWAGWVDDGYGTLFLHIGGVR